MTNAEIDRLKERVKNGQLLTKAEQLKLLTVARRSNRRIKQANDDLADVMRRDAAQVTGM